MSTNILLVIYFDTAKKFIVSRVYVMYILQKNHL